MNRKSKIIIKAVIISFSIWLLIIALYNATKFIIEKNGMELRSWVDNVYALLTWGIPVILIGVILWTACSRQIIRGWKIFLKICFFTYCVAGTFVFMVAMLLSALSEKTEGKMNDGNLIISDSSGYNAYYAEPIGIFARKKFEWDNDKYAESLSEIYKGEFNYIGKDDNGNPQFTSPEYFNIPVTVYGVDSEIDEDLRYMVTSTRLQQEWDNYFTHGEELIRYYQDYYSDPGSLPDRNPVYAIVVYRDSMQEASEDIASFIRNECQNAKRSDDKALYKNMNGSIFILFKEDKDSDYCGTRNIPYGKRTYSWIYDENADAEEIYSDLKNEFM